MQRSSRNSIQSALASMVSIVRENGGFVHAELAFDVTSDGISVLAPPSVHGELLVQIPRTLLIPLDGITWENHDGLLHLSSHSHSHLTPIQSRLLEIFIHIYNAGTPLKWAEKVLPLANISSYAALSNVVRTVLPRLSSEVKTPIEAFMATRKLGLKTSADEAIDGRSQLRHTVLMPVIDFFNHHPDGAGFKVREHGVSLRGACSSESEGKDDGLVPMYASYGQLRDSFMMAINYGYLEKNTSWIFSAPFQWEDAQLGVIEVRRTSVKRTNKYRLPQITDHETLSISHVIFDMNQPRAWKVGVQLALTRRARRLGLSDDVATDALERFVSALIGYNMACYQGIKAQIGVASEPWQKLLIEVSSLILVQLKIIKNETL